MLASRASSLHFVQRALLGYRLAPSKPGYPLGHLNNFLHGEIPNLPDPLRAILDCSILKNYYPNNLITTPIIASTIPTIQNLMTTLYAGQPIASKWWWMGVERKIFLWRNFFDKS